MLLLLILYLTGKYFFDVTPAASYLQCTKLLCPLIVIKVIADIKWLYL